MPSERFSDRIRGEIPYSLLHVPISDMREGQRVNQCFLVRGKTHKATRKGDQYLDLILADRTGTIPAKVWSELAERCAGQFDEGEFVCVEGSTTSYRNELQLTVVSIRRLTSYEQEEGKLSGFDPSLLVPTSEHDIDTMWLELHSLAESIEPSSLQQCTLKLLDQNAVAFKEAPAAISKHHAYLGGLLEHTLEVAQGVAQYAKAVPSLGLHYGLAVAGAILHDIGKLQEMVNPIAPSHSAAGHLIGHVVLGRDMAREAAFGITWADPRLLGLLEHILLSHHGELEYGAAILPKTPEAIAVYHFDNLSAKLNMMKTHIASDTQDGDFTAWEPTLSRRLFKGRLADN